MDVSNDFLTVNGEKKAKEKKDKNHHLVERSHGAFRSRYGCLKATLSNGALKVVVPKLATTQSNKIEVKGG